MNLRSQAPPRRAGSVNIPQIFPQKSSKESPAVTTTAGDSSIPARQLLGADSVCALDPRPLRTERISGVKRHHGALAPSMRLRLIPRKAAKNPPPLPQRRGIRQYLRGSYWVQTQSVLWPRSLCGQNESQESSATTARWLRQYTSNISPEKQQRIPRRYHNGGGFVNTCAAATGCRLSLCSGPAVFADRMNLRSQAPPRRAGSVNIPQIFPQKSSKESPAVTTTAGDSSIPARQLLGADSVCALDLRPLRTE